MGALTILLAVFLSAFLWAMAWAIPIYFLWNWLVVAMFHAPEITYGMAIGIVFAFHVVRNLLGLKKK